MQTSMKIIFTFIVIFFSSILQCSDLSGYKTNRQNLSIVGFKVLLFKHSITYLEVREVITVLTQKLTELSKIIKPKQVLLLQHFPIFIKYKLVLNEAMGYHKSKAAVVSNGYPASLAKGIEIYNMQHFLERQKLNQPYLVLH